MRRRKNEKWRGVECACCASLLSYHPSMIWGSWCGAYSKQGYDEKSHLSTLQNELQEKEHQNCALSNICFAHALQSFYLLPVFFYAIWFVEYPGISLNSLFNNQISCKKWRVTSSLAAENRRGRTRQNIIQARRRTWYPLWCCSVASISRLISIPSKRSYLDSYARGMTVTDIVCIFSGHLPCFHFQLQFELIHSGRVLHF